MFYQNGIEEKKILTSVHKMQYILYDISNNKCIKDKNAWKRYEKAIPCTCNALQKHYKIDYY